MDRKINLGNFESASVTIGLSRVPVGATEEQISQMLETANLGFKLLGAELNKKIAIAKRGANGDPV